MYPIYFSAVLKTEDGQLLEIGQACVSDTENSVDFTSDFVPLLKLGETARITRTLGSKELESFVGQVYLSSRKLLRIVSVENAVMESARRLFSVNENLPTELYLAPGRSTNFNLQKAERVNGAVRFISSDVIKLHAMEFIGEGQYVMFSAEGPGIELDKMMVRVKERVLLMRNAAILICEMISPTSANRSALEAYLARRKRTSAGGALGPDGAKR